MNFRQYSLRALAALFFFSSLPIAHAQFAATGAELQISNSTVGSTPSGDSLLLLPNLGRDAASLVTLQVGVTPGGQVGGTQNDQSSFHLDGGNNSDQANTPRQMQFGLRIHF